jgi:DNA modification methylase
MMICGGISMNVDLRHGDCVNLMRAMPENSVDSIVTDPPYGLEFMGKEWDKLTRNQMLAEEGSRERERINEYGNSYAGRRSKLPDLGALAKHAAESQAWHEEWAREALRVLKPGGHLLAFSATRTYHRMACAIEDAGFEIRDSIHWVYGSGFPKSLNVGKAIDKAAGAEREVVGVRRGAINPNGYKADSDASSGGPYQPVYETTTAATDEAKRWSGWGTALKPAHEPIVVARKPLSGTVAGNVLVWGTGGLNIDGCRVGTEGSTPRGLGEQGQRIGDARHGFRTHAGPRIRSDTQGRWPANIVLDGAAAAALDQQSGERGAAAPASGPTHSGPRSSRAMAGAFNGRGDAMPEFYADKGGASRFFTQADFGPDDWPFVYQAKPSKRERNAGLDGLPARGKVFNGQSADPAGNAEGSVEDKFSTSPSANHHPTVKPVALMRHLVRLVTPPGGTVLDPFAGSGTTLVAAVLEGMNAIGCEMTDEYLPIIEGRVAWAEEQVRAAAEAEANPEQPTLL